MGRIVTSPEIVVYINGNMFGNCADLTVKSDTPRRALQTIDYMSPVELIPGAASVGGSIQIYRIHGAGAETSGMVGQFSELTRERYFSILVIDRLTDSVIFQATSCSLLSQSLKMGGGFVMGTLEFTCLDWNNEIPNSSGV